MAFIFKLLCLILFFLGLIFQGDAMYCPIKIGIGIRQSRTGKLVNGMAEWKVRISNRCVCGQTHVKLNCNGFQTTEAVDPSILSISDGVCLLKNGKGISRFEPVEFLYAWDHQFPFQPISANEICF